MSHDVSTVLADVVSRARGAVGILGAETTLGSASLPDTPAAVRNPEDVGRRDATLWFLTDLRQLLDDRGPWLRRILDELRALDAHLVVVAAEAGQEQLLAELGWTVESITTAYPFDPDPQLDADPRSVVDSVLRLPERASDQAGVVVLRATAAAVDDSPVRLRPFLSVVMRTQGRRAAALTEALTALSAQTCNDFELVLVGHDVDDETAGTLRQAVAQFPAAFADRVRILTVHGGGRSTPLNAGFEAATGRYLAMLDDDDVPFAHWVETFAGLARDHPGRVVRTVTVNQATSLSQVHDRPGVMAEHGLVDPYPDRYRLSEHMVDNSTPNMAVAIPRAAFHAYGLRVDDALTTHEDWEFITRATNTFGTVSSPERTALYRWWLGPESSRTIQSDEDRERNIADIHRRHEEDGVLFQGADMVELRESLADLVALRKATDEVEREHQEKTDRMRADFSAQWSAREEAHEERMQKMYDELTGQLRTQQTLHEAQVDQFREELAEQDAAQRTAQEQLQEHLLRNHRRELEARAAEERDRVQLVQRLGGMLQSRRWHWTAPLRAVQRIGSKDKELRIENFVALSKRELHDVIYDVTRTRSWRLADQVKRATRLFRPGR